MQIVLAPKQRAAVTPPCPDVVGREQARHHRRVAPRHARGRPSWFPRLLAAMLLAPRLLVAMLLALPCLSDARAQPSAAPDDLDSLIEIDPPPVEAPADADPDVTDAPPPVPAPATAADAPGEPPDASPDVSPDVSLDDTELHEPPPSLAASLVAILVFAFAVWVAIRLAQASLRLGPR